MFIPMQLKRIVIVVVRIITHKNMIQIETILNVLKSIAHAMTVVTLGVWIYSNRKK